MLFRCQTRTVFVIYDVMELSSRITSCNIVLCRFLSMCVCLCVWCHYDECLCSAGAQEQLSVADTAMRRW